MSRLRKHNNAAKRQRFRTRPHDGTKVAEYVDDGIPTMHIFWDYGRDRERGSRLRWLRLKVRRVAR